MLIPLKLDFGYRVIVSQFFYLLWMQIFRKRKHFISVLCLLVVISVLKFVSRLFSFNCSFQEIEQAMEHICDSYNNGDAIGNSCAEICNSEFLQTCSCLPHHLGKDVVFIAYYKGEKVVVKSSKLNTDNFDHVFWVTDNKSRGYPSLEAFHRMVKDNLLRNLNINFEIWKNNETYLISKLWNSDLPLSELSPYTLSTAMNNIWHLLQQNEYLFLKYYEDENIFPKILGTCGHFYLVEYIHIIDNLFMVLYPTWKSEFSMRAALALKILDYIEHVATEFPGLHFCDMKMGHFGMDGHGNIKFLDVDMVFFKPSLIENILAVEECSQDEDCSFINCQGSCDNLQQKCQPRVLDTNFQRICSKIFSGQYFGLLSFPPPKIADKLSNTFDKCLQNFSNETVSTQLKLLLQTVIL